MGPKKFRLTNISGDERPPETNEIREPRFHCVTKIISECVKSRNGGSPVHSPPAWFHPDSSEAVMKGRNPEHRDNFTSDVSKTCVNPFCVSFRLLGVFFLHYVENRMTA
jgi:hypothetical protein